MLGVAIVALVVVGVAVLVQDDDGDAEEREAYVDALVVMARSDNDLPESDNRCLAEATVDVIGVDALRGAATPEEISAEPDTSLRDRGLTPDDAQAEELYERFQGCIDIREQFLSGIAGQLPPDVIECVDRALDEALLQRLLVANLVDGNEYLTTNPGLEEELRSAVEPCQQASS